ncbi:MAG: signal peptidase I [Actinobacteria bacterium]|nr:signal peptidase I [Actinomycetota bacterium]
MNQDRDSFYHFLRELPLLLVAAVIVAFVIKTFVVQPFWVPTGSMIPTIMPNDRVLAFKFIYKFSDPKPGDIIVFLPPNGEKKDYIKRVIAVEGQRIKIKDGLVYINGKPLREDYLSDESFDSGTMEEIVVPKGYVFVMGDNRPNSLDSRSFGPISKSKIIGKAFMIYWPINRIRFL